MKEKFERLYDKSYADYCKLIDTWLENKEKKMI